MYRAKHRSIHYYLWDIGQQDKILKLRKSLSFWLTLTELTLILFSLILWKCGVVLCFRLFDRRIEDNLPDSTLSPAAGGHLNIGIPLFQSTGVLCSLRCPFTTQTIP